MYSLKDVSTCHLNHLSEDYLRKYCHINSLTASLERFNIQTFAELEEQVLSGNPYFQNNYYYSEIERIKQKLAIINAEGRVIPRYFCANYENTFLDNFALTAAERFIPGSVLPLTRPLNTVQKSSNKLGTYSISYIKKLLSTITKYGNNAFTYEIKPAFPAPKIAKLLKCLALLEEQMVRIAKSTPDYATNQRLFYKDYTLKREIIFANLEAIIMEFLAGDENYIFGTLNEQAKNKLYNKVVNTKNDTTHPIRENTINLIANYTTSEELMASEDRPQVLARFH